MTAKPTFREMLFGSKPRHKEAANVSSLSAGDLAWINEEDWHFECPVCHKRTPFSDKDSALLCGHCFSRLEVDGWPAQITEEKAMFAPPNVTHLCKVVAFKPEIKLKGIAGNLLSAGAICWYPGEGCAEIVLDGDHLRLMNDNNRKRVEGYIMDKSPNISRVFWPGDDREKREDEVDSGKETWLERLNECPFCGESEDLKIGRSAADMCGLNRSVICENCEVEGPYVHEDSPNAVHIAVMMWNGRARDRKVKIIEVTEDEY